MVQHFPLRCVAVALTALLALLPAICLAEPTAEEKKVASDYLRGVQEARLKLRDAAFAMGKTIGPLVQELKDIDVAETEARYADVKVALGDVKKSMAARPVPAGESGAAIDKAWKAFAKVQTRVIEIEMASVIAVLDDRDLNNEGKKAQILKLIDRILAKEKKDSEALAAAQDALQAAFGLAAEAPK